MQRRFEITLYLLGLLRHLDGLFNHRKNVRSKPFLDDSLRRGYRGIQYRYAHSVEFCSFHFDFI